MTFITPLKLSGCHIAIESWFYTISWQYIVSLKPCLSSTSTLERFGQVTPFWKGVSPHQGWVNVKEVICVCFVCIWYNGIQLCFAVEQQIFCFLWIYWTWLLKSLRAPLRAALTVYSIKVASALLNATLWLVNGSRAWLVFINAQTSLSAFVNDLLEVFTFIIFLLLVILIIVWYV